MPLTSRRIAGSGGGTTIAIGGTVTSGTAGSVLFVGAGPVLAQDNTHFFWDNTNKFLGVGLNAPAANLDILQEVKTSGTPTILNIVGGAHTTLTAGTVPTDINVNLGRTVNITGGNFIIGAPINITPPTYTFTTASTGNALATVVINGAPIAGTNCSPAFQGGMVMLTYDGTATNTITNLVFQPPNVGASVNYDVDTVAGLVSSSDQGKIFLKGTANFGTIAMFAGYGAELTSSGTGTRTVTSCSIYYANQAFNNIDGKVTMTNGPYAFYADGGLSSRFSGNVMIGGAKAAGASAVGVLALSNSATAPSTSVDLAQLFSVDNSAGHATLGVFTEEVVAVDVGVASTHSLVIQHNGQKYKWALTLVP